MRRILGFLFKQTTPGAPTPGVLVAGSGATPLFVTTDPADMVYHVSAGLAVTTRTVGAYLVGTTEDVEVETDPADGTNPRIDRIYIVQPDPELTETGVARIDVVVGTPGASPALPALPAGALELGRKLVPAGASNTDEGTAISNRAPATTLVGASWADIADKPSTFTPATHTHPVSQLTDLSTNGNAAKVGGHRVKASPTTPDTTGWVAGDIWVKYTP